jgi:hypothetical protein
MLVPNCSTFFWNERSLIEVDAFALVNEALLKI